MWFVFELVTWPQGYFGKMNSTLGSVVPLAMFIVNTSLELWCHGGCGTIYFHPWKAAIKTGLNHFTDFCLLYTTAYNWARFLFTVDNLFCFSGVQRPHLCNREPTGLLWAWQWCCGDDFEDPHRYPVWHRPVWKGTLRQPCCHPGQPSYHAGIKVRIEYHQKMFYYHQANGINWKCIRRAIHQCFFLLEN